MKKIDKILRHNPQYKRLKKPMEAARVCEVVRNLSDISLHPISFKRGLLTVAVSSTIEAGELQMKVPEIIAKINQKIGKGAVERIRFKVE